MKKVIILPGLVFIALVAFPDSSFALSCIDPEGAIEYYAEQPDVLVVTAIPKENKEHIKVPASQTDPNAAFNTGYTAQLLEIKEAHRGSVPDKMWVYFQIDGTWNYLCAGAPAEIGSENIYVLQLGDGMFSVTGVAAVYPADSEIGKKLIKEIKANNENVGTPEVYQTDKTYWLTQLHDQLKDMAFIVRVKLSEWNFWLTS